MAQISSGARQELLRAVIEWYRTATTDAKRRILDEFVAVTGYHRKYAIRLLNSVTRTTVCRKRRGRSSLYDEAVREALIVLWEASDRVCGKRLKPMLPVLVSALERHNHLKVDAVIRERLFRISASTIDRMLAAPRRTAGGRQNRSRTVPSVRRSIPVRTFADWNDPVPGFVEADLVAHCGETVAGSFAHTLVLTDIASGWTECVALLVREGSLVVDALQWLPSGVTLSASWHRHG